MNMAVQWTVNRARLFPAAQVFMQTNTAARPGPETDAPAVDG
jgi:hypothetical protein